MKNETKLKRDAAYSSHGAILAACDLIAANTAYSLLAAEAALGAYAAAYDAAARKAVYEDATS